MIQLHNVTKEFGNKIVLDNVNLAIYDGEKIGIVGENGQGKSTLIEIITGKQAAENGSVVNPENFGFLEQNAIVDTKNLLTKLNDDAFAKDFSKYLNIFKISNEIAFNESILSNLSCGERTKIRLCELFALSPNTLILDEPTNHLDINSKEVLINLINDYCGTVLLVSHDVDFLNRTIYKIIEVKNGKLTEYLGNFNDYQSQKENEKLRITREYEKHQKKIKEINK